MKGLILKDILMLKETKIGMLYALICLALFPVPAESVMSILAVITSLMMLPTFTYDEASNWYAYAATFPDGRKNMVKAKYIATIIADAALTLGGALIAAIVSRLNVDSIQLEAIPIRVAVIVFVTGIMVSALYPVTFKFGSKISRFIAGIITGMVVGGAYVLIEFSVGIDKAVVLINSLGGNMLCACAVLIALLMLGISYVISEKICRGKEF